MRCFQFCEGRSGDFARRVLAAALGGFTPWDPHVPTRVNAGHWVMFVLTLTAATAAAVGTRVLALRSESGSDSGGGGYRVAAGVLAAAAAAFAGAVVLLAKLLLVALHAGFDKRDAAACAGRRRAAARARALSSVQRVLCVLRRLRNAGADPDRRVSRRHKVPAEDSGFFSVSLSSVSTSAHSGSASASDSDSDSDSAPPAPATRSGIDESGSADSLHPSAARAAHRGDPLSRREGKEEEEEAGEQEEREMVVVGGSGLRRRHSRGDGPAAVGLEGFGDADENSSRSAASAAAAAAAATAAAAPAPATAASEEDESRHVLAAVSAELSRLEARIEDPAHMLSPSSGEVHDREAIARELQALLDALSIVEPATDLSESLRRGLVERVVERLVFVLDDTDQQQQTQHQQLAGAAGEQRRRRRHARVDTHAIAAASAAFAAAAAGASATTDWDASRSEGEISAGEVEPRFGAAAPAAGWGAADTASSMEEGAARAGGGGDGGDSGGVRGSFGADIMSDPRNYALSDSQVWSMVSQAEEAEARSRSRRPVAAEEASTTAALAAATAYDDGAGSGDSGEGYVSLDMLADALTSALHGGAPASSAASASANVSASASVAATGAAGAAAAAAAAGDPHPAPFRVLFWNVSPPFDRLFLLQMFDRSDSVLEAVAAALAGAAAVLLPLLAMRERAYGPAGVVGIALLVGTALYALLKSPQPDVSSPRPDSNPDARFTRAFYAALLGGAVLALSGVVSLVGSDSGLVLFGTHVSYRTWAAFGRDAAAILLPWLVPLHLTGVLPQWRTFCESLAEAVNVHVFGASANPSPVAAVIDLVRNVLACTLLTVAAFPADARLFGWVFSGTLAALAWLVSRFPCDHRQLARYRRERCALDFAAAGALLLAAGAADALGLLHALSPARGGNDGDAGDVFFVAGRPAAPFAALAVAALAVGAVRHWVLPNLRSPSGFFGLLHGPVLRTSALDAADPPDGEADLLHWPDAAAVLAGAAESSLVFLLALVAAVDLRAGAATAALPRWCIAVVAFHLLRGALVERGWRMFLGLAWTLLFFNFDAAGLGGGSSGSGSSGGALAALGARDRFALEWFVSLWIVSKGEEVYLKLKFAACYLWPFSFPWGAGFHCLVHPLTVPHTSFMLFQVVLSSLIGAPFFPVAGSAFFATSYPRTVRFWERSYHTRSVDDSQKKLSVALDEHLASESEFNSLNSVWYEHLMVSLASSLNRDIQAGRFDRVHTGDFFLIGNETLHAVLHLIELGNGYSTFQLRGMEFKGTYCHERELEEIFEPEFGTDQGERCLRGALPRLSEFREWRHFRQNSWRIVNAALLLRSYSVALQHATNLFHMTHFRQMLLTFLVRAAVFYAATSDRLPAWLAEPAIAEHLRGMSDAYADLDPAFDGLSIDFAPRAGGVSLAMFSEIHGSWVVFCLRHRQGGGDSEGEGEGEGGGGDGGGGGGDPGVDDGSALRFCFAVSLFARRVLLSDSVVAASAHLFLQRLHACIKGDIRVSSAHDEFVLADPDIIPSVVGAAARASLRLHQDSFLGEDFDDWPTLHSALERCRSSLVCCAEGDPVWRNSVIHEVPSLLSLRPQLNEARGGAEHMIVNASLRSSAFRVVRLNREVVRGLWAAQQHELVFLGNDNSERGSIQNLVPVLRNLVNQSCDFPLGYPIFVSPTVVTSFSSAWPALFAKIAAPFRRKRLPAAGGG